MQYCPNVMISVKGVLQDPTFISNFSSSWCICRRECKEVALEIELYDLSQPNIKHPHSTRFVIGFVYQAHFEKRMVNYVVIIEKRAAQFGIPLALLLFFSVPKAYAPVKFLLISQNRA